MDKHNNGDLLNSSVFGSEPNDPNNSFMKKVTKRVSGLIPSSFTKWFGTTSPTASVIRRRESDEEDEGDNNTSLEAVRPPPKKRAKLPTVSDYTVAPSYTSTPVINNSNSDLRYLQPGPSGYTRHSNSTNVTTSATAGTATTTNYELVNGGGDDKSSDSGDSTSGYSSVLTHQPHHQHTKKKQIDLLPNVPEHANHTSPEKLFNLDNTRSLFSETLRQQKSSLSSRRPAFNSSVFGSPSFVDRTLSTKQAVNSPFYGGRTMFGGASAYRRNRIIFPRDRTTNAISVRNSVDIKPRNESETNANNDNVSLSKTARRILDALEHFSTPVQDAKKIPTVNRKSINESVIDKKSKVSNRQLLIPEIPDLLKMKLKERLQDTTERVRKVATTSKSVLNTEYSIRTVENSKPDKHVNKMKTKVNMIRDKKVDNDTVDMVKLPQIPLPITNLPKFDFCLPPPPASPVVTTAQIDLNGFKFANPIVVTDNERTKSIASDTDFKFSEPLNAAVKPAFNFKSVSNTTPRPKQLIKNNGQNTKSGFSVQPAPKLTTGSVMDILGKKSDNLMDRFKPAAGTWECSSCMVRNVPTATRCLACETLKEPEKKNGLEFGAEFKMSSDKWECNACLVRNDKSATSCVSCTTPKSGTATSTTNSTNSGFGDKFKTNPDTWECSVCMIRNKNDTFKCAACETLKPNSGASVTTKLNFDDLIKKQQQSSSSSSSWCCDACMVWNSSEKSKCVCCETPKPGTQFKLTSVNKTSGNNETGFKFGIDKSTETSTSTGFTFGIKPTEPVTTTTTTTGTGFVFGIPPTKDVTKASATTTSTTSSNTTITSSVSTSSVSVSSIFGSKNVSESETKTTSAFTFNLDSNSVSVSKPKPTIEISAKPSLQFTFGSPSSKPIEINGTPKPVVFNLEKQIVAATEKATGGFNFAAKSDKPITFNFEKQIASTNPLAKAVFSTNTSTTTTTTSATSVVTPVVTSNSLFTFGGNSTTTSTTAVTTSFSSALAQNGVFNFGAPSTTPVATSFTFGSSTSTNVFGSNNQANTAATLTFGGNATTSLIQQQQQQPPQQQIPAFNPDVKPNFNFSEGTTQTFTAQGASQSGPITQRKIRKAIRRIPR